MGQPMYSNALSSEQPQWVIWNGSLGILDTVTIGEVETSERGTSAWLEEPYDMVGPFSLDELEQLGQISFAACIVMSRQRWQLDQVELRREALKHRRRAQERIFEFNERSNQQHRGRRSAHNQNGYYRKDDDRKHRELLSLPLQGELKATQIKIAFRRLAQKSHPDVGGSHEQFVEITAARDALLKWCA